MTPSEIIRTALAMACQDRHITLDEWDKAMAHLDKLEGVK